MAGPFPTDKFGQHRLDGLDAAFRGRMGGEKLGRADAGGQLHVAPERFGLARVEACRVHQDQAQAVGLDFVVAEVGKQ